VAALPYAYGNAVYVADGGTVAGNVTFGASSDLFLQTGTTTGVSGTIDGGDGLDIFGWSLKANDNIVLGQQAAVNFEANYVEALGTDTRVTLTATDSVTGNLYLRGDGTIVNEAAIDGAALTYLPFGTAGLAQTDGLTAFVNRGTILGGVNGAVYAFTNSGTVGAESLLSNAVYQGIFSSGTLSFDNSGKIVSSSGYLAASLDGHGLDGLTATNSGTMIGGLAVSASFIEQAAPAKLLIANSGTIAATDGAALSVYVNDSSYYPDYAPSGASAVTLTNSGTITGSGTSGTAVALYMQDFASPTASSYAITNTGTIAATGDGTIHTYPYWYGTDLTYTDPAVGLSVNADNAVTGTIVNNGTIEATGATAVAVLVSGTGLDLTNNGTIRGGTGTGLAANDLLASDIGGTMLAGAIQTIGSANDRIVNTGTIIGSIDLGSGNDEVENRGRIEGNVFLGGGDDSFLQRWSAPSMRARAMTA
jgi:hypothetical protein